MNKNMLSICLEEVIFDKENQDLIEFKLPGSTLAGNIGRNLAITDDEAKKHNTTAAELKKRKDEIESRKGIDSVMSGKDREKYNADREAAIKYQDSLKQRQNQGEDRGKTVLAAAYAGGAAYLIYKGIKSLYTKLKVAKTPEAKAKIKSQIDSKKIQLKKAKAKGKK